MPFDLKKLEDFPQKPGVYVMKDAHSKVLYVGKANNLKQRVKQYFFPGRDNREMIPFLISKVEAIECIIVTSEKEALLLENTLIKQHVPKYNAILKDDKTYIALKVTTRDQWPMVQLVRYRGKPKADGQYFGPYTSAYSARQTLDLLQRLFPMRQCSDQELARRTRPCILYDMKRCIAPCVGMCTQEEYDTLVKRTIQFLKGQDQAILKELYADMEQAALNLEFEQADQILKTIQHIERTIEGQLVDKPLGSDTDVVGLYRQGEELAVALMIYRSGKLLGVKHYHFSNNLQTDAELLESFLMQHYPQQPEIPHEVLLPLQLDNHSVIAEVLSASRPRTLEILYPQRGAKRTMLEMAYTNAEEAFKLGKDQQALKEKILLEMQELFQLEHYPRRIECIDNSNLGGTEPVSALISFKEGQKDKSNYRKFKIKTAGAYDDYAALREVLLRRYQKAKIENNLPDLLMIDGGKGHLGVAHEVFEELDIATVDIISLAKEEGRHDKGMTAERVFVIDLDQPVTLKPNSSVLFLLQQIRDEAHRFAITFQRHRRSKQSLGSVLDAIAGIGPVKRKALLKYFGSVRAMKEATLEQLKEVKGISDSNARTLLEVFQKRTNDKTT